MGKIVNRFSRDGIITVHDNLLADLYSLNMDNHCDVEIINGDQYLVNQSIGRNYSIGLRVKIPKDLITINGKVQKFVDLYPQLQNRIEEELKEYLYFSNIEIFITNMLMDKFLKNGTNFEISIKELEGFYRKGKNDYSKVRVSESAFKRYVKVLSSLEKKEIFLKTNKNFRQNKYGVNNIDINQPFIRLINPRADGTNNIRFSYSFWEFGRVIKLSRRYSNTLSKTAYMLNMNQALKHVVAYFVARDVFIANGNLLRVKCVEDLSRNFVLFRPEDYYCLIKYDSREKEFSGYSIRSKIDGFKSQPNKNRTLRMMANYVSFGIGCSGVYDYETHYEYTESEWFEHKHEFDYDLEGNLDYEFSLNDVGQDVMVEFTVNLKNVNANM